ncbi:MAG: DNA polymerase III subunit gamma/tau [Bdellovibrionales bacterium]|nr:DNA polymerase III subunit gamma/tau [Bdellovibrionales bacterium]
MAYQVIARKWRPKTFAELIGQDHISQTLHNALHNERLPHALLFTGPRGTGKTSTARILAKAIRCPQAINFNPCNECSECELISQGQSVDVIEIDGASNNGVDAVRELRESVGYRPSHGKYKVYIIDEVHMLTGSAFNALLKTLEEPPDHVIFIMATTEAHKIPNTILSRCQRFDFRRIATRKICQHLENICQNDGVQFEPEALWAIARQGDGSMRDSQSLLDQIITFSSQNITLQSVVEALGLTDRSLLRDTLEALTTRDLQKALDIVAKIFASGLDVEVFTHELLEVIRHLLIVKVNPSGCTQIIDLPDSEIEFFKKLSTQLTEEDIHLLFDMALKGANDVPRAQEPRLILEMLLLRMAQAPRIVDLQRLLRSSPDNQSNQQSTEESPSTSQEAMPKPPVSKTPEPSLRNVKNYAPQFDEAPLPSSPEPESIPPSSKINTQGSTATTPEEKWSQLVEKIKAVNGLIAAKLEHSYPKSIQGDNIVIAIPAKMKFLHQQVSEPDFKKKLTNYIKTFWGKSYNLDIQLEAMAEKKTKNLTPHALAEKKETIKQAKTLEEVENHPLVKHAQSLFKTQIQDIKEIK